MLFTYFHYEYLFADAHDASYNNDHTDLILPNDRSS